MNHTFAPCPSCSRHVRLDDVACPFCRGALDANRVARPGVAVGERLGRAALFAFGVSLAACGSGDSPSSTTTTTTVQGSSGGQVVEPAPTDGGASANDASASSGPPNDNGMVHTMYGVPAE